MRGLHSACYSFLKSSIHHVFRLPLFLWLASSVLPVNRLKDAKTQILQSWRMTKPHNCPLIHFKEPLPPLFSTIDLFTNSQKMKKMKNKDSFCNYSVGSNTEKYVSMLLFLPSNLTLSSWSSTQMGEILSCSWAAPISEFIFHTFSINHQFLCCRSSDDC